MLLYDIIIRLPSLPPTTFTMTFAFRHQPLRAIYLTFTLFTLILLKVPFYACLYAFPAARPRRTWSFKRCMIVSLYRAFIAARYDMSPFPPSDIEELIKSTKISEGFVRIPATPELTTGSVQDIAKVNGVSAENTSGFWYGSNGIEISKGRKALPEEKVIYHFCGGGFVTGTSHPSSGPTKTLIDGLRSSLPGDPALLSLEYRKSSGPPFIQRNPFPAALLDAVAGYHYLLQVAGFKPQNIIIAGDSAGGLLAFWLAYYLQISRFPDLPQAGGLLLLSPTVDWANTQMNSNSSMKRNASTDFVYPILASKYTLRALLGNIPEKDAPSNIWMAPGSATLNHTPGLFAGLPPTCILCGGGEQTLDAMQTLKERLESDLGSDNIEYIEFPDATHDFLTATWHEPERSQGLERLAVWAGKAVWSSNN